MATPDVFATHRELATVERSVEERFASLEQLALTTITTEVSSLKSQVDSLVTAG